MRKHLQDAMDQVTMPENLQQRIQLAAMEKSSAKRSSAASWLRATAATAAMLVLIFALSPTARAAINDWVVKYIFSDSNITVYEQADSLGNTVGIVGVVDTEAPAFAQLVNSRLYFVGNGKNIDITEQITEEEPYYYTYVDEYGLTHGMAVGYHGSIENFGIYEFIWEDVEGQKEWVTGSGRNFLNPETEIRYPWVDAVWNTWNVPWPMPGE